MCVDCMLEVYDREMENQVSLSLDGILRNFESQNAMQNISDLSISVEHSDEGIAPAPNSTPNTDAINQPLSLSQNEMPPPPSNPRLAREYKRILNQPGPKSVKRQRLSALGQDSQIHSSLEDSSNDSFETRRQLRSIIRSQSRERSPIIASPDSSGTQSNTQSSEEVVARPVNTDNILSNPSSVSVSTVNPSSEEMNVPVPSHTPSINNSLRDSVSLQSVPSPDSPVLPRTVHVPLDGNQHSNGAAPRRIFMNRAIADRNPRAGIPAKNLGG